MTKTCAQPGNICYRAGENMGPSILSHWTPLTLLQRLWSAVLGVFQIMRLLGSIETSWAVILGAIHWFLVFSGLWLHSLAELVASWLSIPFDFSLGEPGPMTLGDFIEGTFFSLLMVSLTGNIAYGRLFMSPEKADAMLQNLKDRKIILELGYVAYSWNGLRFILKISAGVWLLWVLSLLLLFFVE
jgi:hypothetical protein